MNRICIVLLEREVLTPSPFIRVVRVGGSGAICAPLRL